ncbi:MAG TPA: type II secretion system protein, partial [Gemmatimonadaceae bacterium]|nr:type II secretion system protein [Gemmatimonadaceae bacterium]
MHHTVIRRRAFTLVELLIVIAVFGLVMAAMMKVLVGQQRFYRGAAEMIDTQTNVRDAVNVLQSELRGLSASQGDILAMDASSISFYEPLGTSIVCQMAADRASVIIPPLQLAAENGLTSWVRTPAATDRVLFYDLGNLQAST